MPCKKNSTWGQVGNQNFFSAGEVLWNWNTSINTLSKKKQRKEKEKRPCRQGNILEFFHPNTLKFAFWMENVTQRLIQSGPFSPKPGHFFDFQIRAGETSPSLLVGCLWMWLNMHQYPWISINALGNAWINCSDYPRTLNMSGHLTCLTDIWRWLRF